MEKKKYEYLYNLDKKLAKFVNSEIELIMKTENVSRTEAGDKYLSNVFDEEKFCKFLQNAIKIPAEEIHELFGDQVQQVISIATNSFSEDIDIIQNRYNANVNCYNMTGNYIQYSDLSFLQTKSYAYYDFVEGMGLCKWDRYGGDYLNVVSDERIEEIDYSVHSDLTPQEYAYAIFYKNEINLLPKLEVLKYISDRFKKDKKFDDENIQYIFSVVLREVDFDKENIPKVKNMVDDIFTSLSTDPEMADVDKAEDVLVKELRTKYNKEIVVDADVKSLSNNADDLGGMGSV